MTLYDHDVLRSRHAVADGATTREVAEDLGVHQTTVARIVRGEAYPDVGGPRRSGRRRGEQVQWAILTEADVIEIRGAAAAGTPIRQLAREYDVSRGCARKVVARLSWAHV